MRAHFTLVCTIPNVDEAVKAEESTEALIERMTKYIKDYQAARTDGSLPLIVSEIEIEDEAGDRHQPWRYSVCVELLGEIEVWRDEDTAVMSAKSQNGKWSKPLFVRDLLTKKIIWEGK